MLRLELVEQRCEAIRQRFIDQIIKRALDVLINFFVNGLSALFCHCYTFEMITRQRVWRLL